MEGLAPPLQCLLRVRQSLESGEPTIKGIGDYTSRSSDEFSMQLKKWLFAIQQGQDSTSVFKNEQSAHRLVLMSVLEEGLKGHPIHSRILELEDEILAACRDQIEKTIALLPFRAMIPILLFQLPAFLILLLGPILKIFMESLL